MFANLRAEMARYNLTPKQICDAANISYYTYKNKMSGETEFKLDEMLAIRRLFTGLTLDYLFTEEL